MAFRIRNNYEADVALTYLYMNKTKLSKIEQQLATGLRIVRAADDATDLFIADHLKHTYVGLQRGTLNAQYGLAAARTIDDALGKIYDILVKIKDKAVEAANAHTDEERKQAQQQINEYVRNIAQIVKQTEFDGKYLLKGDTYEVHFGSHTGDYMFINADSSDSNGIALWAKAGSSASKEAILKFVQINSSQAYSTITASTSGTKNVYGYDNLGGGKYELILKTSSIKIDVTTQSSAEDAIQKIEDMMTAIDQLRGYYAGIENKLQNIVENNQIMVDNLKEGESVVRNVDYASAFTEFRKTQIITQANIAALAQANQIPQLVQQLMR